MNANQFPGGPYGHLCVCVYYDFFYHYVPQRSHDESSRRAHAPHRIYTSHQQRDAVVPRSTVYRLVCTYFIICVIRPRGVTGLIRYTRVDEDGARRTRLAQLCIGIMKKKCFKKKRVNDRKTKITKPRSGIAE